MDPVIYISFMIILLIICVLGLIGNVLEAIILARKNMRTSTNYFMLGLTLSDCLLLILSFLRTLNNLVTYLDDTNLPLKIFLQIWDWICTCGTRYFTVVVSLERFVAVCFPLKARIWVTEERARNYSIAVFILTIILAIFALFYSRYFPTYGFDLFAALVVHFVPFVVLVILNTFIYNGVRKFKKTRKTLTRNETKEISVTKMLICVVLVFGFCHSFEIARRIMTYAKYFDYTRYAYYDYTISYLADFFYVFNSSVNFIIYYMLVREFRKEFFKIVNSILSSVNKTGICKFTLVDVDSSTVAAVGGNSSASGQSGGSADTGSTAAGSVPRRDKDDADVDVKGSSGTGADQHHHQQV